VRVIHDCSKELVPVLTVSPLGQEPLLPEEDDDGVPLFVLVLAVPGRAQAISNVLPSANAARRRASVRKCFLAIIQKPFKWYRLKYALFPLENAISPIGLEKCATTIGNDCRIGEICATVEISFH